jgi:hypothetical protein
VGFNPGPLFRVDAARSKAKCDSQADIIITYLAGRDRKCVHSTATSSFVPKSRFRRLKFDFLWDSNADS